MKIKKQNGIFIFAEKFFGRIFFLAIILDAYFFPGSVWAQTSGILNIPNVGLPSSSGGIQPILANFLNWLLGIVGVLAVISFVIAGLQYILAAGDSKTIETAKRNMTYSAIGIIVALSGFIVLQAVTTALGGSGIF